MQRLQFSISWLQTTKVSFTSVLETEVNIFLPPPIIPTPPITNFWKIFLPPSPQLFPPSPLIPPDSLVL